MEQLLVPKEFVSRVLFLAHTHQLGAHLAVQKTYDRILGRFYWPGVKSPLIPLPIIEVPFSRIALDVVGPLPKSGRGHKFILVSMDYTTRFPEAIPLSSASAQAVARELFLLFSRVGIAKEISPDQGTCFMSKVVKALCTWLKVKQLRTSVYHPLTDCLVERFNCTLKQMLKKVGDVDGKNWDQLLPYVLFAIREVPQTSMGYSTFELLYGQSPQGLLDLAKESWESQQSPHCSVVDHVEQMQVRMKKVWPLVREHMEKAQAKQARTYNQEHGFVSSNQGRTCWC